MGYEAIEGKRIYLRAEAFGVAVWEIVHGWDWFDKKSLGLQWTRAADSIGANIAEAGGRFHPADVKNFLYHPRGSLRGSKFWLRRARQRNLITEETFTRLDAELEQLSRELNLSTNHQKQRQQNPQ
jgi:four helix bundle protein